MEASLVYVDAGVASNVVNGAVRGAQEAVNLVVRISVVSRDRPRRVDAVGDGALEEASARPRSVERGDGLGGQSNWGRQRDPQGHRGKQRQGFGTHVGFHWSSPVWFMKPG